MVKNTRRREVGTWFASVPRPVAKVLGLSFEGPSIERYPAQPEGSVERPRHSYPHVVVGIYPPPGQ